MKTDTNTVKAQILSQYDVFETIPKVADVKAEINGTEYRVKIHKGSVTKIVADRKAVLTPSTNDEALAFIDDLVHPTGEQKIDPVVGKTKKTSKKTKVVVDDKWIAHLVERANESTLLSDGDQIRFRVATSHGRPVCAHIDLYQDDQKVATAGIHHRIGFATRGVNGKWLKQVDEAIKEIYRKVGDVTMLKSEDAMVRMKKDDRIVDAQGSIQGVLELIQSI